MNSRLRSDRLRILVLGYIVRGPLGGLAWHHLQYVMGLAGLGHDVHFLEDSGDTLWSCYDPSRHVTDRDPSYGLRFTADAFRLGGVADRWAYFDAHGRQWHGPAASRVRSLCRQADVVLNLSGANPIRPWLQEVPVRVLIDTDPVFTQIRHLTDAARRTQAGRHNAFFTYGENFGKSAGMPDDGFAWQPTRQPIVLKAWRVTPAPIDARFTTIMQWDSYRMLEYCGRRFGMKSESFAPYVDLPVRSGARFEVAVGGDPARAALAGHGWSLRNPLDLIATPSSFRAYIRRSKAEFTVAKQGYTVARTGWFSDRSAAYLASGRPVVTQDTGFSTFLPVGEGLLAFSSLEEAVASVHDVSARYEHHCRAARRLAEEHFASADVLGRLLERAFARQSLPVAESRAGG
jgi:hypothetical protein